MRTPLASVRGLFTSPAINQHEIGATHIHRDIRGGSFRASLFGISDGLVSNVSLVLGTFGAHPGGGVIRLAGLAGLFGGSFSMAAGEYVSMQGQREAFEREIQLERVELELNPVGERVELERIYVDRGITTEVATQLAGEMMAEPELALVTHAREELGIDPGSLGSPLKAAFSSFGTFALGALVPLIPFLSGSSGLTAAYIAIGLTALAALATGATLSLFTLRTRLFSSVRSLAICAAAGAITYGIGTLVGASTH